MRGNRRSGAITLSRPYQFWLGVAAVTAGVALHLPMFIRARDDGYMLAGMAIDMPMIIGMVLIALGTAATIHGVMPTAPPASEDGFEGYSVRALDNAPIRPAHIGLLLVMALAVTIDVMKPVTLGFVAPGMAREYGLRSPVNPDGDLPVALLPLAGIVGTVIGSFVWGWLGDRIGRRPSILLAGILFVGTAVCGSMPSFSLNLAACFIMGLGVGGMLPITFALIAETIPARHRGWLIVLIGGDVAGAYVITSWLSSWLTPDYGWRILWLISLPTGLLLLLLNRWIPESPRFLLATGREDEARAVMERYGAGLVERPEAGPALEVEEGIAGRWRELLSRDFLGTTLVVSVLGLGVGFVTFGFQLWIPSNLQALGFTEVTSDRILRDAALIGLPATVVIALMYGFWSSKKTIIVLSALTAVSLMGLVAAGNEVAYNRPLLYALLVVPVTGISSILAVLVAYSAEAYPTTIRSRGTGLAAGASKAGGVLIIALVVVAVAPPSIRVTALIGAVPMALAAVIVAIVGVETRRRRLEEITAEERGLPSLSSS